MNGLVSLEPRELDEFVRCWETWFDVGDYERMAGFYAEDARLIATQVATVEGRPAIAEFFRLACEATRAAGVRRTVQVERAESAGELGYLRGTVVLSRPSMPEPATIRYVTLWKPQADRVWRIIEDISSAAPSAPAGQRPSRSAGL
jgi:uncharacterized protein (TIGR02246 family)